MRCRFIVLDNEVIAISKYAGKTIKASAKCSPGDVFDVNKGKMLAERKLDVKVLEKRLKYAAKLKDAADIKFMIAMSEATEKASNLHKIQDEYYIAASNLNELIQTM